MALHHRRQATEANIQITAGRFVVESSVKQQKLFLALHDKITRKLFKSSFTSSELHLCGFSESQSQKLETIGNLIQSAQVNENGLGLNIIIPQDNNEAAEDGLQGIMNMITEFRYAQIIIVREDKFFGDSKYTLKLGEVARDIKDVNKESIDDIKEDMNYMREQIATLTADLSIAKQHTLPKGSILEWFGTRNNVPKFWEIYEEHDDAKDEPKDKEQGEDEEGDEIEKDIFTYESDFDKNGIVYALGAGYGYGTKQWHNPSVAGLVEIRTASRMGRVSKPKDYLLNREPGVDCYINAVQYNWFIIDFKNILIRPTNYTLRHDAGPTNEDHLRNWQLQGSNDGDGDKWTVLINHENDDSLNEPDGTHTWTIPDITEFYQYFRLKMTWVNGSNRWYICCSGFEIYGEIKRQDEDGGSAKKMHTLIKIV